MRTIDVNFVKEFIHLILFNEDQRDVLHYYVNAPSTLYLRNAYSDTLLCRCRAAYYAHTRRVSPTVCAHVTHPEQRKYFTIRDDYWFSVQSHTFFILFLGLSDY